MASRGMSEVLYLYGFVPGDAPAPPPELAGLDQSAVEDVQLGEFRGVISRVDASVYQPERMAASMRDLAWVAQRGLAHERVVAWFVDHAQILPAPLFTLYSSTDALREAARARAGEVSQQLRRLSGLHEWDLKVAFDAAELEPQLGSLSHAIANLDAEIAAAAPGRRYLLEKKRSGLVSSEIAAAARAEAERILDLLRPFAREVRFIPLPQADHELPVVFYAALLVPAATASTAAELVAERASGLARLGIRVDYSGPWAPYRFLDEPNE
jgi:hypothetical protein